MNELREKLRSSKSVKQGTHSHSQWHPSFRMFQVDGAIIDASIQDAVDISFRTEIVKKNVNMLLLVQSLLVIVCRSRRHHAEPD